MAMLNGRQKRHLRALGHLLKPVVIVGQSGPSPQVFAQIERQLEAHELIKIKVLEADREEMAEVAKVIGTGSSSHVAQVMGHTVLLYRRNPEKPRVELPR